MGVQITNPPASPPVPIPVQGSGTATVSSGSPCTQIWCAIYDTDEEVPDDPPNGATTGSIDGQGNWTVTMDQDEGTPGEEQQFVCWGRRGNNPETVSAVANFEIASS